MRTKGVTRYPLEHLLIASTLLLSAAGFWSIYLGAGAAPEPHHHLHLATVFAWLLLLAYQLRLVARGRHAEHRRVGLLVLLVGPVVFAASALLAVHSAHQGLVSGRGDALLVQNVGVTLELGALIVLAFVFRKRRKLHAALLLSTVILFMGIALFFTLLEFAPQYRIEGPETFHRFAAAATAAQIVAVVVATVLFLKDVRNGWPFLLAAACFLLNQAITRVLAANGWMPELTEFVGTIDPAVAFVAALAVLLSLLAATGLLGNRTTRPLAGA